MMEKPCPDKRTYQPGTYLFSGQELVLQLPLSTLGQDLLVGTGLYQRIGPWAFVEPLPETDVPMFSTCSAETGDHYHHFILTGSHILPPRGKRMLVHLTESQEIAENDAVQTSYQLRLNLGMNSSDKLVLTKCENWETILEAKKVELLPLNLAATHLKPRKDELPVAIKVGLILAIPQKTRPHPLYGELFWTLAFYRISKINDRTQGEEFYRMGVNTSLFPREWSISEIPIGAQFALVQKTPSALEAKNLTVVFDRLSRLLTVRKSRNVSTPVHISGPKGSGKRALVRLSALQNGFTYREESLFDHANVPALQRLFAQVQEDTVLHIRHFAEAVKLMTWGQTHQEERLRQILEGLLEAESKFPVVVIATSHSNDFPSGFRNLFHLLLEVELPGEEDRFKVLQTLCDFFQVTLDCTDLSRRTAGKSLDDLLYLIEQCVGSKDIDQELEAQLTLLRQRKGGAEGIPNVKWEDVGGLEHAKSDIIDTVLLPMQRPDLFRPGVRQRSGLLLYGPPGTGKTLLAKAVATECALNFIAVKGPELLNMYIGESEANIRSVFQRGRDARPCVLFFDELDSLAPARGTGSDSGGVMDRIVSQLLTELDGTHKSTGLYVIGATNRPDLLDSALLRPGRFDKMIYLGLAEDTESQVKILKALTGKFHLKKDCDLEEVASACEPNYTGADFYALCSDALMSAYRKKIEVLESTVDTYNSENYYQPAVSVNEYLIRFPETADVEVGLEEFQDALKHFTPSLSAEEVARYKSLKAKLDHL